VIADGSAIAFAPPEERFFLCLGMARKGHDALAGKRSVSFPFRIPEAHVFGAPPYGVSTARRTEICIAVITLLFLSEISRGL
jgi:hypothetical protein